MWRFRRLGPKRPIRWSVVFDRAGPWVGVAVVGLLIGAMYWVITGVDWSSPAPAAPAGPTTTTVTVPVSDDHYGSTLEGGWFEAFSIPGARCVENDRGLSCWPTPTTVPRR